MKKYKLPLPVALLLVVAAVGLTFSVTFTVMSFQTPVTALPSDTSGGDPAPVTGYYDADKLDRVIGMFYDDFIKTTDPARATDYLLKGFIEGAGDIYCDYMTAEEYKEFNDSYAGNYVGIGVTVTTDPATGAIVVIDVTPDSPASEAGVLPTDILYKVDGTVLVDESGAYLSTEAVATRIRGEEGTSVSLTVLRDGKEMDFTMTRRALTTVSVRSSFFTYEGKTAAVINITSFDLTTPGQFKAAVDEAEKKKVDFVIYDLRNNPGGMLTSVEAMLTYILPDDSLICTVDYKNGKGSERAGYYVMENAFDPADRETPALVGLPNGMFYYNQAYADHRVTLPSAVIINGNSASAAELFTSALRDYEVATVVGETSYGKGCMQVTHPLPDGSALKVTSAYYNPPCGVNFDRTTDGPVGIAPAVEVIFTPEEKDRKSVV